MYIPDPLDLKSKWKHIFKLPSDRSKLIVQNQYDATESLGNLFTFYGTTIHFIFWKPITWIMIGMHYFGFFYLKRYREYCIEHSSDYCWADEFTSEYSIQATDIAVFTTLVVFLFVAYNNMCSRSILFLLTNRLLRFVKYVNCSVPFLFGMTRNGVC